MIIDEKVVMNYPPPPYLSVANSNPSTPIPQSLSGKPTLPSLPPHILIQILYALFPDDSTPIAPTSLPLPSSASSHSFRSGSDSSRVRTAYDARMFEDTKPEKQRKVLFWLSTSLRLVSRHLYIACMHVLRSIYLPSYQSLIRPPYSSDPFPLGVDAAAAAASSPTTTSAGSSQQQPPAYGSNNNLQLSCSLREGQWMLSMCPIKSLQRETTVLDRYIALKVRQDVFADDTELHIEPEEAFRDLFDVAQPRARLEDLTRIYGVRDGVVTAPGIRNDPERIRIQGYGTSSSSKTSSLTSLQTSSPVSPAVSSPSTSTPQLQPGQLQQKTSRSNSRSIFSFMKKSTVPVPQTVPAKPPIQPLPFSLITVSVSPRKVGLIYNRTRTIAEVQRAFSPADRRSETLEILARALVRGLREYLEDSL